MKGQRLAPALCLTLALLTLPAYGAETFIYPNQGQSPEQQSRDRSECHTWAVGQTGFDPTAPQATSGGRRVLRGAGRGAAVGAVGGAIAGDAGKGAAIGAATGGLFGGMKRRDEVKRQDQTRAAYDRAVGACLSGRGYTVR